MRLLDSYLIREFFKPFGACLMVFAVLVVLGRFFDKMQIFTNYQATARDVAMYLLLTIPFWLNLVLPIAVLLAILFSLGALQQRREITACFAAGIPPRRLFAPYILLAIGISFVSLVGGLTFLPKLNFVSRGVYKVRIKKEQVMRTVRDDIVAAGRNHRRFTIGWLDVDSNLMKNIVMDQFDDHMQWSSTVSASLAKYENGRWTFYRGRLRRLDPHEPGVIKEERFEQRLMEIEEKPSDFLYEDKHPDDMTGLEIGERVKKLRRMGIPFYRELVTLHSKFALPFANLIVVALAIPFALRSGHKGRMQTFGYALGVVFMYWGIVSVCESFGNQGRMAPWFAAWLPNFMFAGIAVVLLRRPNG